MNEEKKPLIIGNWKATKTIKETVEWIKAAKTPLEEIDFAQIVVCIPHTCLPIAVSLLQGTSIKIGAQDVSRFREGAYTGETTAKMLDGLVEYCLVGHSERRSNFNEKNEDLVEKVKLLSEVGIKSVVCISEIDQVEALAGVKDKIDTIAYEPLFAIGSDKADSPENAGQMAIAIRNILGNNIRVIYGGSVDASNVVGFLKVADVKGVLPGRASWESSTFLNLLEAIKLGVID